MTSALLTVLIPGSLIAAITKWLAVGGRERRRRHRLTEELDLLTKLRNVHPTSASINELESRIEDRTRDYLTSTDQRPRKADGRWAMGIVLTLSMAAWVWAAAAGVTPEHVTIDFAFLATLLAVGIGLGVVAVAVEPLIRAGRRM